jgi:hypothetical protein
MPKNYVLVPRNIATTIMEESETFRQFLLDLAVTAEQPVDCHQTVIDGVMSADNSIKAIKWVREFSARNKQSFQLTFPTYANYTTAFPLQIGLSDAKTLVMKIQNGEIK